MNTLKLMCRKCAAKQGVAGIAFGGAMFVEDGVGCPFCDGEEEDFLKGSGGKTDSGGQTRKEESGGRR